MVKEFLHPENTPESHLFIRRIQKILGVSGHAFRRALGIQHPQSWQYIRNGAKLEPYVVERILTFLSVDQLVILRAELIKAHKDQIEKNRFPKSQRPKHTP